MTVIRVNPTSVAGYGRRAQDIFGEIHAELVRLVNGVVEVHYFGPNAVDFKTRAGQLAADFANKLHADISAMAEAVRASTSAIASSLGGQPITITVSNKAITPPTPAAVDYVDVDTDKLSALQPVVTGHFNALAASLDSHLSALTSTDWTGNAKDTAVASVGRLTSNARSKCQEAQRSINEFIAKQVESSLAADR